MNFGLVRRGTGNAVLERIPIPELGDEYILVRTVAVALNPTDWTSLDAIGDDGTLVGCDYAGIVEEVGKAVTKNFKKGDRIAGFAHGANDAFPAKGAFARFITVKGDVQMHIPENVSLEAAACVGAGVGTTGYALYHVLRLPIPNVDGTLNGEENNKGDPLFIYGGSTATGTIAVQFAKLSGKRVITTCSPKHFDLLKGRGADAIYDYSSSNVGEQINRDTNNELAIVLDAVNTESTAAICAEAIGSRGGKYCNLLDVACPRPDVESSFFLGYSLLGEEFIAEGVRYPAQPEDFIFARTFYEIAENLWADGKWEAHPQAVRSGGLRGVPSGLQDGRDGKISGVKYVYRVDETEWPLD